MRSKATLGDGAPAAWHMAMGSSSNNVTRLNNHLDTVYVSRQFSSRLPQRLRKARAASSPESGFRCATLRFMRETTLALPSAFVQQAAIPRQLANPIPVGSEWVGAIVPLFIQPASFITSTARAKTLA